MIWSLKGAVWHTTQIYGGFSPDIPFMQYFRDYFLKDVSTGSDPTQMENFVGMAKSDPPRTVIRQLQLVRFGHFHPVHHLQAYFYNVLLDKIGSFRHEREILSSGNTCLFQLCAGLVELVQSYAAYQMLSSADITEADASRGPLRAGGGT